MCLFLFAPSILELKSHISYWCLQHFGNHSCNWIVFATLWTFNLSFAACLQHLGAKVSTLHDIICIYKYIFATCLSWNLFHKVVTPFWNLNLQVSWYLQPFSCTLILKCSSLNPSLLLQHACNILQEECGTCHVAGICSTLENKTFAPCFVLFFFECVFHHLTHP